MEEIKCTGCGVTLQTKDVNKEGYLPEHVLAERDKEHVLCQRCFRLKNYQELASNDLAGEDYLKVINEINATNSLIVLIVDVFDFSGSFLPNIKRLTGQNDVILAANKVDLLPESVNPQKILSWIKEMLKEEGLNVLDSILISSKHNLYIFDLYELIKEHKGNRDVYIVGSSNVGKSKLINQLLKHHLGSVEKDPLTVSYCPNTTLNFVGFPFGDGTMLYDTPGVLNRHQYLRYVTKQSLKMIVPQSQIKPFVYQLDCDQTLFIGGLARFDFLSGDKADKSNVVLYFSNKLSIHRTKLENADELYRTKLYSLLVPPFSSEENIPKFTETEFHKRDTDKYDIVISGLGFISLRAPFRVVVHAPAMVGVYIRKAII